MWRNESFSLRNCPSRNSTLFSSRQRVWHVLNLFHFPLCEVVGLFRSSNLQVTIFRISISIFKGRPKGKIRPTFLFWQAYNVFSYRARTNSISFTFIPHKSYRDLIGEIKWGLTKSINEYRSYVYPTWTCALNPLLPSLCLINTKVQFSVSAFDSR